MTEAYRRTAGFALQALRDDPRSLIEQPLNVTDRAWPRRSHPWCAPRIGLYGVRERSRQSAAEGEFHGVPA